MLKPKPRNRLWSADVRTGKRNKQVAPLAAVAEPGEGCAPFVARPGRCVVERDDGSVATLRVPQGVWRYHVAAHLRGTRRLGVFATLPDRRCRWGCLDLDAHDAASPSRHAEAMAVVEALDRFGIVAYLETSRGGRGAHVWVFFDAPGVAVRDLHTYLAAVAGELSGHVDVFPRAPRGDGGAVFLPYFGSVVNVRDLDGRLVAWEHLEGNAPSLIPSAPDTWPPPHWGLVAAGDSGVFAAKLAELRRAGVVWIGSTGHPQARQGHRNAIAGAVARAIVQGRGTLEDFIAWDRENMPPLGNDEPAALQRWWQWAEAHTRPNTR